MSYTRGTPSIAPLILMSMFLFFPRFFSPTRCDRRFWHGLPLFLGHKLSPTFLPTPSQEELPRATGRLLLESAAFLEEDGGVGMAPGAMWGHGRAAESCQGSRVSIY